MLSATRLCHLSLNIFDIDAVLGFKEKTFQVDILLKKIAGYERIVLVKEKLFLKNKQHKIFDNSIDHL